MLLVGFPLGISRRLVERWTGCTPDEGLEFATLGLPPALFAGAVVLVFPGGPFRESLGDPIAVLTWTAFVAVVSVGPAVAGTGLSRLFQRL